VLQLISKYNDLIYWQRNIFKDNRGSFSPLFDIFELNKLGVDFTDVILTTISTSYMSVIRGLHFQTGSDAQSKIVTVLSGSAIDVVVDLRSSSTCFGQSFSFELTSSGGEVLFVPKGFAHGFMSLENNTIFHYNVDNEYNPGSESGICFNDPNLGIDWGEVDTGCCILSTKDLKLPRFVNDRSKYFPNL